MKNKKQHALSRRTFLRKTASGIGGAFLAPYILPSCRPGRGVNDQVMTGHIGVGNRGTRELLNYFLPLDESRSVAICDVRGDRREKGVNNVRNYYREHGIRAPECEPCLKFEEILDRDDVDAVHITTPDHWHVPASVRAARAGKHIMVAKPLGLSYPHYLELKEAVEENDVRFHYATQQRSYRHMQLGIDMIREGKIGDVHEVLVWCPGKNDVESPECIVQPAPVPSVFDYDRWIGPAPAHEYCPERFTNQSSYFIYDYSIGFLAGWGAHPLDIMVWGVKDQTDGVYSCEGTGSLWPPAGMYDVIISWDLSYQYESGLKLRFISTDRPVAKELLKHREREPMEGLPDYNGTTFYGDKGWISLSRSSAQSNIPELDKKLNDFPKQENGRIISDENTMGRMFIDVIRGRTEETCPLDEAIISDTVSHMGDIAIRTGRRVTWDPLVGELVGDGEANALYARKYRPPYDI